MAAFDELYELIMALFESGPELRRFLTLVGLEDVEHRLPATKGESLRTTAADASALLLELGLVQESLFTALARRDPDRAEDIWGVAHTLGIEEGEPSSAAADVEPEAPPEPTAAPEVYADFAAELADDLAAVPVPNPDEEAMGPSQWPWTAAASVLGSFRPRDLKPLPNGKGAQPSALTALAAAVFTTADGRWALEERVRTRALATLWQAGTLTNALDANEHLEDLHRDVMRRLVTSDLPSLARVPADELDAMETVLRWLDPRELTQARATVYAAAERRALIDPLRKLVGAHFRGRAEELSRIERHIDGTGDLTTMAITGPGGTGKSSLLGKVLLQLEERIAEAPISFAYVDFDKRRHDPRNPRGLVEQIVRQLRLLYAVNIDRGRELAGLESATAGTDEALAAEVLDLDDDAAKLDLDGLIAELAERLERIPRAYPPPLVLVLDTFEEVQIQGPGALEDVRDLLRRFERALPGTRAVLSGRGDLSGVVKGGKDAVIELGDLDPLSADAVLESLAVADCKTRDLIYERFGGNPLVLHLAAEALRRMDTAERAFKGVLGEADVVATVGIEQIQGMLYERILGHIADPEIVKVAHPGLAVRRIDVDVIREVLAEPCGLDPRRAQQIFDRLQREVSMFQVDDDGALRHRQDVRRLMLRLMTGEPRVAQAVAEIHPRAVAFYAPRKSRTARAEEVYHRLMTGQDPRTITVSFDSAMRGSLMPALEDPLPGRARTWLRRRLGLIDAEEERAAWAQEDWEADAESRVRSWLASADPQSAADVLAERSERLPGSPLYALEVAALVDRGRLDEATEVLERGMLSCSKANALAAQLELAEQARRIAERQKDPDRIVAAARSAIKIADLSGDELRAIGYLTDSLAALQQLGASEQAHSLSSMVAQRFSRLRPEVLRENPRLVRAVMQTAGATESSVLAEAALTLGDLTSERDAVFRDDVFGLTRLLEGTAPEARQAMNELATEVGLPEDKWTPRELAASAVRRGRTARAVVVGLDYAKEESDARQTVLQELARPIDLETAPWRSST